MSQTPYHFVNTRSYHALDTPGSWTLDGNAFCKSLELPRVALVEHGLSCIPEGDYRLVMAYSPRFSKVRGAVTYLPRVLNLCGGPYTTWHGRHFDDCGILCHGGNLVNSIPEGQPGGPKSKFGPGIYDPTDPNRTDSDGCLLVGTGFNQPAPHKTGLYSSQAALQRLTALLRQASTEKRAVLLTIQ